ncbi:MAG: CAP domain-containing protein [Anaerolineaceae bacterium]|nr:CAP domain-containing protein [Anaerolineaceae bacterium]
MRIPFRFILLGLLLAVLLSACEGQTIVIPWQGKTIEIVPRWQMAAVEEVQLTSTLTPFQPIQDSNGQVGLTSAAEQQLSTASETMTATVNLMSQTPGEGTPSLTQTVTVTGTVLTNTITQTVVISQTITPTPSKTQSGTLALSTATTKPSATSSRTATRTRTMLPPSITRTRTHTNMPATSTYTLAPVNTSTFTVMENTRTSTNTSVPSSCVYNGNSSYESTLIGLINDLRTSLGLTPYGSNALLGNAARGHSQDMACNNYFSHTGLDGSTSASRVAAAGYSYSWVGENIYAGSGSNGTPQMAFNYWVNSDAHYANMTNSNYTEIGIGFITCADSYYKNYFTANFARP